MPIVESNDVTIDRAELKFQIESEAIDGLVNALSARLPSYHHGGRQSALATLGRHYTTTVYFDTSSHVLWRAAISGDPHIKLRVREYYDVLPLAELAVDEAEMLRAHRIAWLELKRREGERSFKRRLGVPKHRLAAFLQTPQVDPELRAIQRESLGAEGDQVLAEMLAFLAGLGEPVRASCVVNYTRASWQSLDCSLRVTLDEDLAVFAPRAGMWGQDTVLTRAVLGTPARALQGAIVEVKSGQACPAWLMDALSEAGAVRTQNSKFVTASTTLYGAPPAHASGD